MIVSLPFTDPSMASCLLLHHPISLTMPPVRESNTCRRLEETPPCRRGLWSWLKPSSTSRHQQNHNQPLLKPTRMPTGSNVYIYNTVSTRISPQNPKWKASSNASSMEIIPPGEIYGASHQSSSECPPSLPSLLAPPHHHRPLLLLFFFLQTLSWLGDCICWLPPPSALFLMCLAEAAADASASSWLSPFSSTYCCSWLHAYNEQLPPRFPGCVL